MASKALGRRQLGITSAHRRALLRLVRQRDRAARRSHRISRETEWVLARLAAIMDPAEDVLFIHLTSHGASNGELATSFWPLTIFISSALTCMPWMNAGAICGPSWRDGGMIGLFWSSA